MEQETFWTLLTDLAHWEFELFLIFLFDGLIGLLIWPWIQKFFVHHKKDDDRLAAMDKRLRALEQRQ